MPSKKNISSTGSLEEQKVEVRLPLDSEATENEGIVKLWVEKKEENILFKVWNSQVISSKVAKRIFQRNFSTKEGAGRGLGTYSIKFFGETYLKGKVDFTSSKGRGTIFVIMLPVNPLSA